MDKVIRRLRPERIESALKTNVLHSAIPFQRKAALWDLYRQQHHCVAGESQDQFKTLFGPDFLEAYEKEVKPHRGTQPWLTRCRWTCRGHALTKSESARPTRIPWAKPSPIRWPASWWPTARCGHEGGEIASKVVVDSVLTRFRQSPAFGSEALLGYAASASSDVAKRKKHEPRLADMSTTVAALLIDRARGQALWAHLGDTRIYLFRNARLHTMSKDHSMTQQLIDAGYARAEQLRLHPQRNILFAAIGAEGDTSIELSA
ncbi:protein phosphatase 2C domain-containing protein [Massilia sp. H-1]|nr:protein phosphatase 2C domain-containing protein [Massilia sp. H-1]